ncbi:MAG: hypothetical protein ABH857_01905 [Elusimicrobiota bacterium]
MKIRELLIFLLLCAGISSFCHAKKDSKTVTADGMAPIINNDPEGARKMAISDALKNALGLVVGVYISQEAYSSKSMLVQDNILSQTQGYIEKYNVIKTYSEGSFMKAKIKATVRREDLYQKIKELDLEPKKFGNPTVGFDIEEYKDGISANPVSIAVLEQKFLDKGFVVKKSTSADILVRGKIETSQMEEQAYEGFVSYRASAQLSAFQTLSNNIIHSYKEVVGGVDVSEDNASKNAIVNAAKKVSNRIIDDVIAYLIEKSTLQLTLHNIGDINKLSEIILSIRALIEVRECKLVTYDGDTAVLALNLKNMDAHIIAKRLETTLKYKVNSVETYGIDAGL